MRLKKLLNTNFLHMKTLSSIIDQYPNLRDLPHEAKMNIMDCIIEVTKDFNDIGKEDEIDNIQ